MTTTIAGVSMLLGALLNNAHHIDAEDFQIPHCYEDEIAIVKLWVPGTPREGVQRECVNTEDYNNAIAEQTDAEAFSRGRQYGFTEGYQNGMRDAWNFAGQCQDHGAVIDATGCKLFD